jgi:hypothetical protein
LIGACFGIVLSLPEGLTGLRGLIVTLCKNLNQLQNNYKHKNTPRCITWKRLRPGWGFLAWRIMQSLNNLPRYLDTLLFSDI